MKIISLPGPENLTQASLDRTELQNQREETSPNPQSVQSKTSAYEDNQNTNALMESPEQPKPVAAARAFPRTFNSQLPVVEEPICVLKIELDGENVEEIKVFENDDPKEIVTKFGDNFNLSQNARKKLLD